MPPDETYIVDPLMVLSWIRGRGGGREWCGVRIKVERYSSELPLPPPTFSLPPPPSLISLTVSEDVKHHERVNNLVFYAQSTLAVIIIRASTMKEEEGEEIQSSGAV